MVRLNWTPIKLLQMAALDQAQTLGFFGGAGFTVDVWFISLGKQNEGSTNNSN